jgi:hypothetical protein
MVAARLVNVRTANADRMRVFIAPFRLQEGLARSGQDRRLDCKNDTSAIVRAAHEGILVIRAAVAMRAWGAWAGTVRRARGIARGARAEA